MRRLWSKIYFIGNSFWKFYEGRSKRWYFKWFSRVLPLMLWWPFAWFPYFYSDCPWPCYEIFCILRRPLKLDKISKLCLKLLSGVKISSKFRHILGAFSECMNFTRFECRSWNSKPVVRGSFPHFLHIKFIYSEKATKFCEISTVDLTGTT